MRPPGATMRAMSLEQLAALEALGRLLDCLAGQLAPGDLQAGWTAENAARWLVRIHGERKTVAAGDVSALNLRAEMRLSGIRPRGDPEPTPLTSAARSAGRALTAWREAQEVEANKAAFEGMERLTHIEWALAAAKLFSLWSATLACVVRVLGTEVQVGDNETHAQLAPFDPRFTKVHVSNRVSLEAGSKQVGAIGLVGPPFSVRPAEVAEALPFLGSHHIPYDAGTTFAYQPQVPNQGSLSSVNLWLDDDARERSGEREMEAVCHSITFWFGGE